MISINSYLRYSESEFVPVRDCTNRVEDEDYIAGAIDMTINDVQILDTSLWDYVDQLWGYIVNMLIDFDENDKVQTSFPDQPIKFSFEKVTKDMLLVSLKYDSVNRKALIGRQEFIEAIREAGIEFFEKMSLLSPVNREWYQEAIDELARIK